MRIWQKRELWLYSLLLAVSGLLTMSIPHIAVGNNIQLPVPVSSALEHVGLALFLAGTVSFGVEELVRSRTKNEFEIQLRSLLETTGGRLSAQMHQFLEAYLADLGRRIEAFGMEVHASGIRMIYSSREKGLRSIADAIRDADRFVYLMGISLRQFTLEETECGRAFAEVYRDKHLEFRVLILDRQSEEALERSSREEGQQFCTIDDDLYRTRTLFRETGDTEATIQKFYDKVDLRACDHQSLFLVITDKVAFVEPYHYGDRVVETTPPHLKRVAELVPLIEFGKAADKGPYEQFLGHFNYVFDRARRIREEGNKT
jgi:hypothetical protein